MVKLATPKEIAEPLAWLMSPSSGMTPLFSALVPYGVHLALSKCDVSRLMLRQQVYTMTVEIHSFESWMASGKS